MRCPIGALAAILALVSFGCGGDSATVAGPSTPPANLSSLQLTGNADLTAVGQTSQLKLTGVFSDSSTRDITTDATWSTSNAAVATVSAGLVTAVSFGTAIITARYLSRTSTISLTALPPGMFIVSGRVREPGAGGLANVRVVEQISNTSRQTDNGGSFQFIGLPAAHLRIDIPDYEPFDSNVNTQQGTNRSLFVDAPMQRVIRVNAGQSRSGLVVAPNDMTYTVGADVCNPCKLIRVFSGGATTLTIRLTWQGLPGALKLWANGTRNSSTGSSMIVSVPTGGGDTLVYVGWLSPAPPSDYAFFGVSVD
jgi:hypothetical protein